MNIHLGVESRNTAKATAKKHAALHLQFEDDIGDEDLDQPQRQLEFEDVGGQMVENEEPMNEDQDDDKKPQGILMDRRLDPRWIQKLLARDEEIARACQAGRCPDESKVMKKIGEVYGTLLNQLHETFPVQPCDSLSFHTDAPLVLELQARRAEAIRRQCDGEGDVAEEIDCDEIPAHVAAASLALFNIDDVKQGPAHSAQKLCHAAELNADQMRAVALVVHPMQEAWEKTRGAEEPTMCTRDRPNQLPLVGTLVRLLLVGGGGCGKTRIFNKVLIPLLTAFYGTDGVVKEASSNKASRLLQGRGKTIHAAKKLTATSSLRAANLRLSDKKSRVL